MNDDNDGDLPLAEYPVMTSGSRRGDSPSRRFVLKAGVAAVATASAYALFSVFPRAREAVASSPPYYEWPYGKNLYGSGVGSACFSDTGCRSLSGDPSTIDNGYCTTCPEYQADPYANWYQYHYNGVRSGALFGDAGTNICGNSSGGYYDLWIHDGQPCGYCTSSIEYRCHDGYKINGSSGVQSVCHAVHRCNGTLLGQGCS